MVEAYDKQQEFLIPGICRKEGLYGKDKLSVDFFDLNLESSPSL